MSISLTDTVDHLSLSERQSVFLGAMIKFYLIKAGQGLAMHLVLNPAKEPIIGMDMWKFPFDVKLFPRSAAKLSEDAKKWDLVPVKGSNEVRVRVLFRCGLPEILAEYWFVVPMLFKDIKDNKALRPKLQEHVSSQALLVW